MRLLSILFTVLLFTSCTTSPTDTLSPTGTWEYTESVSVDGTPVQALIQFNISPNNTYSLSAIASLHGVSTTLHSETGTWSLTGNSVTLNPSSCQDFDFTTAMLTEASCSGPTVLVINGDSMTDGTITVSRK